MSVAVCGLALLPVAAKADTFNFSSSGTGVNFSGTLSASKNTDGSYTIQGVTGNGIAGPISSPFFPSDNLLLVGGPRLLDVLGFGFTDVIGGVNYAVNLYSDNSPSGFSYYADLYDPTGNLTTESVVSFTAAVTPEPSTWLLLGTGMAAMMAFGYKKRLAL